MTELQEKASYYKTRIQERLGVSPYTEQDVENYRQFIEHWIRDRESSGRAYFGNIRNDVEVSVSFIRQNMAAVKELIRVRQKCTNCEVSAVDKCPHDLQQRQSVRDWEGSHGLAEGTVSVKLLKSRICVKNCDKPGSGSAPPVYRYMLIRPDLLYSRGGLYIAFGPCPVRSNTFSAKD